MIDPRTGAAKARRLTSIQWLGIAMSCLVTGYFLVCGFKAPPRAGAAAAKEHAAFFVENVYKLDQIQAGVANVDAKIDNRAEKLEAMIVAGVAKVEAMIKASAAACDLLPSQVVAPASISTGHPASMLLNSLILPQRRKAYWNTYYEEVVQFIAERKGGEGAKLNIVEVGTAYGGNAASLAKAFQAATVVAVDPLLAGYDKNDLHSRNLDAWAKERAMTAEDFSLAWAQALAHDGARRSGCRYHMVHLLSVPGAAALEAAGLRFDVAFIDGLHTYEGVVEDIRVYAPLMRPGGIVIFNDYGANSPFPGVTRAVDEFVASRGLELIVGSKGSPPGSTNAAVVLPS